MISFGVLRGFLRKEFKQALRDPRMKILLFLAPILQLTIFGIALSSDVKNIRLWAQLNPYDFVLQHIMMHSLASQWFIPATNEYRDTYNVEPFTGLQAGEIDAAIVPSPGGLTHSLGQVSSASSLYSKIHHQGQEKFLITKSAELQLLIDATNVLQAQSVESYLKTISKQVLQNDTKTPASQQPLNFKTRVLFNPSLETPYFLVPGVMCILICLTSVVLTSISITREIELGTFEMLICAPVSATEIILGKTVPYVVLAMTNLPLILIVAMSIFHVPMRGSLLILTVATFAFVCSAVAIGTLISTFAKNQQQSILGGFLFLFPAILLSGLLFSLDNMPIVLQGLAALNPLSHFLTLVRNIMLKGGEAHFIIYHVSILILMAIVFVTISFKRFHTTLQ